MCSSDLRQKVPHPDVPTPRSSIEWVAQLYRWERDSLGASIAAMEADYRKVLAVADERQVLLDAARQSRGEAQDVALVSAQKAAKPADQNRVDSEAFREELQRARALVDTLEQEIEKARGEQQRLAQELESARRQAALAWRDANQYQRDTRRNPPD